MKKIYISIIIILTTIVTIRYIYLSVYKHNYYYDIYITKTNKIVNGINAPRGRILDRNGKVLVDNIGINTIVFHQINDTNTYEISKTLNNIIEVEPASLQTQKEYYLKYEDTNSLLTLEEQSLYERRKLTLEEIEEIKLSRIIPNYTEEQQKIITIYNLLNNGYYYDYKIVKEDVSDEICAKINTQNIPGLTNEYTKEQIEEHMSHCKECKDYCEKLRNIEKLRTEDTEYMRAYQRKLKRWTIVTVASVSLIVIFVLILFIPRKATFTGTYCENLTEDVGALTEVSIIYKYSPGMELFGKVNGKIVATDQYKEILFEYKFKNEHLFLGEEGTNMYFDWAGFMYYSTVKNQTESGTLYIDKNKENLWIIADEFEIEACSEEFRMDVVNFIR